VRRLGRSHNPKVAGSNPAPATGAALGVNLQETLPIALETLALLLLVSHAPLDAAYADTLIDQVFPAFERRGS
jgi:hypothetical protein